MDIQTAIKEMESLFKEREETSAPMGDLLFNNPGLKSDPITILWTLLQHAKEKSKG